VNWSEFGGLSLARAGRGRFDSLDAGAGPQPTDPESPIMTASVRRFALALVAFALTACTVDKAPWADQKTANDKMAVYYQEQEYEGRLYVFGTEANYTAFQTTHDLQFAKSFIGAGPKGETVRLELDPKDPALFHRLHKEYESRHATELED
jgi:hypothetical protein